MHPTAAVGVFSDICLDRTISCAMSGMIIYSATDEGFCINQPPFANGFNPVDTAIWWT